MSTRSWFALGLLVAAGATLVLVSGEPTIADSSDHQIAFISVSGEGQNARAWYKGAPPAGVPVQDALDHFAEDGFRVAEMRPYPVVAVVTEPGSSPNSVSRGETFLILLEK